MNLASQIAVLTVGLLHVFFMIIEMFLWTTPRGLRAFGQTYEKARDSAVLAANQGLYNGFLAIGLVWGLVHPDPVFGVQIKLFFLSCISHIMGVDAFNMS
jgi:putative membrane protein